MVTEMVKCAISNPKMEMKPPPTWLVGGEYKTAAKWNEAPTSTGTPFLAI